jgi:hypothetical protein
MAFTWIMGFVFCFGLTAAIVLFVVNLTLMAKLERENKRLRDELERLKKAERPPTDTFRAGEP